MVAKILKQETSQSVKKPIPTYYHTTLYCRSWVSKLVCKELDSKNFRLCKLVFEATPQLCHCCTKAAITTDKLMSMAVFHTHSLFMNIEHINFHVS